MQFLIRFERFLMVASNSWKGRNLKVLEGSLNMEWRGLWKLKVHARFKNLLWKMVWRMLPVGEELKNRSHIPSTKCFLCKNAVETIEHIFLQCSWSSQVWLMAPWPLNMSNLSHIDIIEWVKCIIDPKMKL